MTETETDTRTDKLIKWFKNNRFFSVLFFVCLVIIGMGALTDAVDKFIGFSTKHLAPPKTTISEKSDNANIETSPSLEGFKEEKLSSNENPSAEIYRLLDDAEENLKQLHLTSPPGNNALEIYRQILLLEPLNAKALTGLQRIASKYVDLSYQTAKNGMIDKAEMYLNKAREVDPKVVGYEEALQNIEKIKAQAAESKQSNENTVVEVKVSTEQIENKTESIKKWQKPSQYFEDKTKYNLAVNTVVSSSCASEADLNTALKSAENVNISSIKNDLYIKIVKQALCDKKFQIADLAASKISTYTIRDDAYLEIVNMAIELHNFGEAEGASSKIYAYTVRDRAYMKIVDVAINQGDFVLAEKVSSEIYAYTTRDDAYMKMVKNAINVRNFELAERASRQIYVSTTRADATKLLVEAIAIK